VVELDLGHREKAAPSGLVPQTILERTQPARARRRTRESEEPLARAARMVEAVRPARTQLKGKVCKGLMQLAKGACHDSAVQEHTGLGKLTAVFAQG
jgi:hypothetical protein